MAIETIIYNEWQFANSDVNEKKARATLSKSRIEQDSRMIGRVKGRIETLAEEDTLFEE